MVPSCRFLFSRPLMPSIVFSEAAVALLARISASGMFSIRPSPNVGVGIRKMTLPRRCSVSKSGCLRAQPGASLRPAIVNSAWTLPSGLPSGLVTNLASRIGPVRERNDRMMFASPATIALSNCGLRSGLLPPLPGVAWQPPQFSRLKDGPRPVASASRMLPSTECDVLKSSAPSVNADSCPAVRPGSGSPAPAGPPRGPGSWLSGAAMTIRAGATSSVPIASSSGIR